MHGAENVDEERVEWSRVITFSSTSPLQRQCIKDCQTADYLKNMADISVHNKNITNFVYSSGYTVVITCTI